MENKNHTYTVERLSDSAEGHRDRRGHVVLFDQIVKAPNAVAAIRAATKLSEVERTWPVESIDPEGEYAQAIDPTQQNSVDHAPELVAAGIID